MNQGSGHVRVPARMLALLAVSALLLASCGTVAVVAKAHLDGTPAISFSVPLSEVSCTLNDVCVAAGTATDGIGPSSVAEFASPKGHWFNLASPHVDANLVDVGCLLGRSVSPWGIEPGPRSTLFVRHPRRRAREHHAAARRHRRKCAHLRREHVRDDRHLTDWRAPIHPEH